MMTKTKINDQQFEKFLKILKEKRLQIQYSNICTQVLSRCANQHTILYYARAIADKIVR